MRHVVIGTAGHIDHGKSALVRALTGTDPDRLKEEKERGITIDLGFAHLQLGDLTFAFVDVPGHERFVRNMLAGASGIDHVLLVVAADESVMPQTREHFEICRLLSLSGGVVVLTKSDLVDADTVELVQLETRELVAGSFLDGAPIVPVSSKTGAGLDRLRAALVDVAASAPPRTSKGATRLPVDRVFTVKGFGTVVTGTLVSGRIAVDQELVVLPGGRSVKVRGLQAHGEPQREVVAGQRTAINLGGVDLADLRRGDTITAPRCFEATRRFDVVLELLPDVRPLRHGARVRFHHGTSEILGRVALATLDDTPPPQASEPALALRPGGRAYARVRLEAPAVLTRGDRYILRAYSPSITIGGGEVLDPQPPRGGVRTPAARGRFERLEAAGSGGRAGAAEAVMVMVEERGALGLALHTVTTRAGVAPEAVPTLVDGLVQAGRVARAGDALVAPAVLASLTERLLAALRAYHQAQPLSEGIPREEARERLFGRAEPAIFERVLGDLVVAERITARDRLALASHRLSLSDDESRAKAAIEAAFEAGGLKPPDVATLAGAVRMRADVIDRILKLLVRQRVLVRLDSLVFHAEALQRLKGDMVALKAGTTPAPRVDVGMFKERYGITRKYAIPLLEYLDRERVTRRMGDVRILL